MDCECSWNSSCGTVSTAGGCAETAAAIFRAAGRILGGYRLGEGAVIMVAGFWYVSRCQGMWRLASACGSSCPEERWL